MDIGRAARSPLALSRLDIGIFLSSFAVLLVELLLTRIFSVTMFHHFSFLAVSLAMMGLGAGGLAITLWPARFRPAAFPRIAAAAALVFALTAVAVVALAFHTPVRLESSAANWRNAILVFGASVVPFSAGGLVVALILARNAERANRLYGLDLLGAACACLVFIPATNLLGAPTAVILAAAAAALAGVALAGSSAPAWRRVCVLAALTLTTLAALNWRAGFYDVRVAKGRKQPPTLVTRWNSFSRVEVNGTAEDLSRPKRPFGYGYSSRLDGAVREVYLRYDADALTQITGFDGDLSQLRHLGYDVTSAPYHMRRYGDVLVIGAGGGRDVLTALALGSERVTGVEVNPLTVQLMKGRFAKFTGGLYTGYPGVEIVQDDGRNFIRRTTRRYELIQASLVDTWAASAAGAYALAENSLYTVDAFQDYLRRLKRNGVLSFSRWYGDPPVEVLRVVVLAAEALRREAGVEPSRHLFVVRTREELTGYPSLATILVKRSPFTEEERSNLRSWADDMDFAIAYAPDGPPSEYAEPAFETILGPGASELISAAPYDLSLVTDERPFFFDRVPALAWLRHRLGLPGPASGAGELTLGGQTLLAAFAVTLFFTLLLVLAPLVAPAGGAADGEGLGAFRSRRSLLWVTYFLGLGLGYIVVEIVVIQRLNLYLGNPTYALSVVLFTMLSASGLGSLVSGRRLFARIGPFHLVATVCAALALYHVVLPHSIQATLGSPRFVRVLLAVSTTAPVAFLMGMPFPAGLRRVGRESTALAAWAWAVNAGASVFGSALAVLVAMSRGFSAAFLVGIGAYAAAVVAAALLARLPERAGRAAARPARRTLPLGPRVMTTSAD